MRAFGQVVSGKRLEGGADVAGCRLVIAGGYDSRLAENREYLEELKDLAAELGLTQKVHSGKISWQDPHREVYRPLSGQPCKRVLTFK